MILQRKKKILLILELFFAISIYYCLRLLLKKHKGNLFTTISEDKVTDVSATTKIFRVEENEEFLIKTVGCIIPNYAKTYNYMIPGVKKSPKPRENSCGVRAVFLDNIGNNRVKFRIDEMRMKLYFIESTEYSCCYKFASQSHSQQETDQLSYTPCKSFSNGMTIQLEQEVIKVNCKQYYFNTNESQIQFRYDDVYILLINKQINSHYVDKSWNVLLIGLDSMSRARLFDTMPLTSYYLKQHEWLDFKGYQKVQYNTFPNLMSVLTGKKMSTIYSKCSTGLSKCADLFIWQRYKDAGYKTAYGEDNLKLPDTFGRYGGFNSSPTDHYMRPLFLTGERRSSQIICTQKKPSATHLLEYAHDFANLYKDNNPFFGLFWINSYTHDTESNPSLFDEELEIFLKNLNNTAVIKNTFVFFFSDHGSRFGKMRIPIESYYDERLPMMFLWVPVGFQNKYKNEYHNLETNQKRLVTPYDVYITLENILSLSTNSSTNIESEACRECRSMFKEISSKRTCEDVGVSEIWCSCHVLTELYDHDGRVAQSVMLAYEYVNQIWDTIKTIPCTTCKPLRNPTIIRSHTFTDDEKEYYVIAFYLSPNRLTFEAVVVNLGIRLMVLSVRSISEYNTLGNCVLNNKYQPYCVCAEVRNCEINKKDYK